MTLPTYHSRDHRQQSQSLLTEEALASFGIMPSDIRRWPVPEYTDPENRAYWLWEDIAPWLNWQNRVLEEVSHD